MEKEGSDAKHKNHQMHGLMFSPFSNYALKSCMLSQSHSGPIEDITKPAYTTELCQAALSFRELSTHKKKLTFRYTDKKKSIS